MPIFKRTKKQKADKRFEKLLRRCQVEMPDSWRRVLVNELKHQLETDPAVFFGGYAWLSDQPGGPTFVMLIKNGGLSVIAIDPADTPEKITKNLIASLN